MGNFNKANDPSAFEEQISAENGYVILSDQNALHRTESLFEVIHTRSADCSGLPHSLDPFKKPDP